MGEGRGLRICFVSSYPPNRARLSEYAQSLVNELAKKASIERIYVLADEIINPGSPPKMEQKVTVLRIWKPDSIISVLGILLHVLRLKPDIVHYNVHFQSWGRSRLANFSGMLLILLSRLLGLKVLTEVHNLGEKVDLEKVQLKPTMINKLGIFVATKLILSSPKVVVTVRSYANYLRQRYGHKGILYIPHGTQVNNLPKIDPAEKVILIFGHMGPYKGLPILFKAFKKLAEEKHPVKLVVAGTSHPNFPRYLDYYKEAKPNKVEFLGYVAEEDIPGVFKTADVVVIPYTTTTGTSGVFHLACGFGLPIVASDLPEIRELVNDGGSAILVPPGDIDALKNAILAVIYDDAKAAEMSKQNLEFAKKESWDVVAKAYEAAYLSLL